MPTAESDDKSRQLATVVVPATIQAFFVTDLYAKDSGYVSQVNNDIGDHVKVGQVLAVIEDPEVQAQSNRAQAGVQQAKAALEVAQRQLAGMQADLTLQQVTLKRQKELFAGKASTAQTLDEARAKQGVSSANVETGKAKITSMRTSPPSTGTTFLPHRPACPLMAHRCAWIRRRTWPQSIGEGTNLKFVPPACPQSE